jgi:hypothetical protein
VVFSLVERGGKLIGKNIELGFAGEVGGSGGVVLMTFHPLEFNGHWKEFEGSMDFVGHIVVRVVVVDCAAWLGQWCCIFNC